MAYDDSRFRDDARARTDDDFQMAERFSDAPRVGDGRNAAAGDYTGYSSSSAGYADQPDFRSQPSYDPPSEYPDSSGYGDPPGYAAPRQSFAADYDDPPAAAFGTGRSAPPPVASETPAWRTAADADPPADPPRSDNVGRDRLGVHLTWELLLLIATGTAGYLLYRDDPASLRGGQLGVLLLSFATVTLLGLAAGASLRVGAPNLAVGPIAVAAGLYFASNFGSQGQVKAALLTGALAVAVGVVIGLLVVVLHVPGWAASLAALLLLIVWIQRNALGHPFNGYQPTRHAAFWAAGVAALAIAAGAIGAVHRVRSGVGAFRATADPAARRGWGAAVVVVLGLAVSAGLAGVAGVLGALQAGTARPSDPGLALTALAIGVALLGGTSAYGRRGGLLGVALAALLVTLVMTYATVTDRHASVYAVAAVILVIGLLVTRLVESFGRGSDAAELDQQLADSPTARIDHENSPTSAWSTTPAWVSGSGRSLDSAWAAEEQRYER